MLLTNLLALSIDSPDPNGGTNPIIGPTEIPMGGLSDAGANGNTSGQIILQNGVTIVIILAIVLALVFFIWGGVQWVMSGGDKHKIDTARTRIIYALIGLMVVFFAYFIVKLIGNFFGIDVLHPSF